MVSLGNGSKRGKLGGFIHFNTLWATFDPKPFMIVLFLFYPFNPLLIKNIPNQPINK